MEGRESRYIKPGIVSSLVHEINARANTYDLDIPLRHNTLPRAPEAPINIQYRQRLQHASPIHRRTEIFRFQRSILRHVRTNSTFRARGHIPWTEIG
jgi:hypothetical protein